MRIVSRAIMAGTLVFLLVCVAIAPLIHVSKLPSLGYLYPVNYLAFVVFMIAVTRKIGAESGGEFARIVALRAAYTAVVLFLGYLAGTYSALLLGAPH